VHGEQSGYEETATIRDRIFLGRSGRRSDEEGPTLEEALEDAYRQAKLANEAYKDFTVLQISVSGTNPITDYRVLVIAGGP
jgi:hypothetical protein